MWVETNGLALYLEKTKSILFSNTNAKLTSYNFIFLIILKVLLLFQQL